VIAHLSDLHFTGHVGRAWFEEVVRRTDALEPDLIAVTGDLVDRQWTFSWIPTTLGRLKARHGVYFILGNHDLKVDHRRLRELRCTLIGPVVTSCLFGSHYAAGTYYKPPTVMHVSRGLSGTVLMRVNCPPELTRLVLRCPRADQRK